MRATLLESCDGEGCQIFSRRINYDPRSRTGNNKSFRDKKSCRDY